MKAFVACIARHKFSKVFSIVTVCSEYGRTLTSVVGHSLVW
jgi:hypothetical protein